MQAVGRKLPIIFPCLSGLLAAYLFVQVAPPMEGTIIDAETGQPISDAVLLIAWREFGLEGGGPATRKMCEIVADSQGAFSIGPRFSIGIQSTAFRDILIGTAATGYISDTLLPTPPDPYISAHNTWWGKRFLTIKMESNDFNMRALRHVAERNEVPVFPPQYFSNGQYNTIHRANGRRTIVAPELAFSLSSHNSYKYRNFWQRSHAFLKKGTDRSKSSPQIPTNTPSQVTCL